MSVPYGGPQPGPGQQGPPGQLGQPGPFGQPGQFGQQGRPPAPQPGPAAGRSGGLDLTQMMVLATAALGVIIFACSFANDLARATVEVYLPLAGGLLAACFLLPKPPKTLPVAAVLSTISLLIFLRAVVSASTIPAILIVVLVLALLQTAASVGALLMDAEVIKFTPKPAAQQGGWSPQSGGFPQPFGQHQGQQPQPGQQAQPGQQPQPGQQVQPGQQPQPGQFPHGQPFGQQGQQGQTAQPSPYSGAPQSGAQPAQPPGAGGTQFMPQPGQFGQPGVQPGGQQQTPPGTPPGGTGGSAQS